MRNNLRLVVNNPHKQIEEKHFFEKEELQVILDLYAKMVSEGSWKDYGLSISSKQVSFSVFRNAAENALYKICKNFKPKTKNLKYLITDTTGKILCAVARNKEDTAWASLSAGIRFDKGCYLDFTSAASQNVVINYAEEF